MMGVVYTGFALELTADRLHAAEPAPASRVTTASIVRRAAMQRQHARVQLSLLLVPDRRNSVGEEAE